MSGYISRDAAIIEMLDNDVDHAQGTDGREVVQILSDIPAADVISKADMITLLEQTEKELVKDTDKYSIAYNFIVSVMGIIKCNIMQMGEKDDQ